MLKIPKTAPANGRESFRELSRMWNEASSELKAQIAMMNLAVITGIGVSKKPTEVMDDAALFLELAIGSAMQKIVEDAKEMRESN
jgi:hypothetical protein